MSRVINFGCSHAFGAEIKERGCIVSEENISCNYGKIVADSINAEFKIAARPGNSNKQILHDVIEFVKPGDICLISWTYFDREKWTARFVEDVENCNFNSYHVLSALQKSSSNKSSDDSLKSMFSFLKNKEEDREKIDNKHVFYNHLNDDNFLIILKAYEHYFSHHTIRLLNFLEIYLTVNSIIKSRNATPINFHFDCEPQLLDSLNDISMISTKKNQPTPSYYDFNNELKNMSDYFLVHNDLEESELYLYYKNDKNRIDFLLENPTATRRLVSFKHWYCYNVYGVEDIWPGNRMGHLDAHAHEVLSNLIINKIKSSI